MESQSKFLSIIIVFDQQDYDLLEKSLKSINSQSRCDNIKTIVIDIIGSLNQEDRLFKELKVNCIKNTNLSYYEALNMGVSKSLTEWACILKLGNTYASSSILEEVISIIRTNDADIYYGGSLKIINNELDKCKTVNAKPVETISKSQPFDFQSCIFKASTVKMFNFNPLYKYAAEYELLVRLFKSNISFFYLRFAVTKSSFSKSLDERLEKLFIISKYFGEEILKNSEYFKRYVRASVYEVRRLMPLYEKIKKTENEIEEQKSTLAMRQSEYAQIKETKVYKFGRIIDGLLSNVLRRADK